MQEKSNSITVRLLAILILASVTGFLWWSAQQHVERAAIRVVDVNGTPVPYVGVMLSKLHIPEKESPYEAFQGTSSDGLVVFGGSHMPRGLYQVEILSYRYVDDSEEKRLYTGQVSLDDREQQITIPLKNVSVKTIVEFVSQGVELPFNGNMSETLVFKPLK